MRIKEYNSENYGKVNYVEVAGIDLTKIKDMYFKFNPDFSAYAKRPGPDIRCEVADNDPNVSEYEKREFHFLCNSIFSLPLEEVNKDWHIINKDFAKGNDFLTKMVKEKTCPIATPEFEFMKWFVKIYPYLNDGWKKENSEYMEMMDSRILSFNQRMLNGFKNHDMKEIRSAIKHGANINFEENGKTPLWYAIQHESKDLLNYLINKKVEIPIDLRLQENNKIYSIFMDYKKKQQPKKLKMK